MLQCDQHDLDTKDAYLESIATYARTHPDEPWILGGGWSQDVFPRGCPAKEDLDAVVSDRPVFLPNRDGHSAWVNSKALEIAGITADTPDPADGRIERNADGSPQGTLHEGAQTLVVEHQPALSPGHDLRRASQGSGLPACAGITGVAGRDRGRLTTVRELPGLSGRGWPRARLTGRVVGALWWERSRGSGADRRPRRAPCRGHRGPLLPPPASRSCRTVSARTSPAPRSTPTSTSTATRPTTTGCSMVDPELLKEAVTRLDATRLPSALPRARRSRGPGGAGCDRGGAPHQRLQRSPGTIWRTCRSCTPTTWIGSGSSAPSRTRSRSGRPTRRRWTN